MPIKRKPRLNTNKALSGPGRCEALRRIIQIAMIARAGERRNEKQEGLGMIGSPSAISRVSHSAYRTDCAAGYASKERAVKQNKREREQRKFLAVYFQ